MASRFRLAGTLGRTACSVAASPCVPTGRWARSLSLVLNLRLPVAAVMVVVVLVVVVVPSVLDGEP